MPSPLLSYVYVSSATTPFSTAQLTALLENCRASNSRAGITGLLLHKDGNFMQALEGPEPAVRALMEKIAHDPRHTGVIRLLEEAPAARQFGEWSMGFRDLGSSGRKDLPGYNEFLNTPLTGTEFRDDPSRAQKLLLRFKRDIR